MKRFYINKTARVVKTNSPCCVTNAQTGRVFKNRFVYIKDEEKNTHERHKWG